MTQNTRNYFGPEGDDVAAADAALDCIFAMRRAELEGDMESAYLDDYSAAHMLGLRPGELRREMVAAGFGPAMRRLGGLDYGLMQEAVWRIDTQEVWAIYRALWRRASARRSNSRN